MELSMRNSFLVFVVLQLSLMSSLSRGESVGLGFDCPGTSDCSCSKGVAEKYELLCPKSGDYREPPAFLGSIRPGHHVQIQCTSPYRGGSKESETGFQRFNLLHGLKVGPVDYFILRLCPLPEIPLKDLMDTLGVPSAKILQVQSHGNLSGVLNPSHLKGLKNVTQLNLNSNSLEDLDENLFNEMTNLTWLDLKNNKVILPKGIFRPIPKLEVLELGANNLSHLEPGLFKGLARLRLLNLWGNRLGNLSRTLFADLPALESLDLNSNQMTSLPPDLFADLINLKNLNLDGNEFISIPQTLLLTNDKLEKFKMSNNRKGISMLPNGFLSNKTQLKEVIFGQCNFTSLPEDLLWGSVNLVNITIKGNQLGEIPVSLLKDQSFLKDLDLSSNRLLSLHNDTFKSLKSLKVLDLSDNLITYISRELFSSLSELASLEMARNKISDVDPLAFRSLVSLEKIDLSYNLIKEFSSGYSDLDFGLHSALHASVKLKSILLSHNNISQLYSDWSVSMIQLQIIDLSHNAFERIMIEELQFLSPLLTLDLGFNKITQITGLEGFERMALLKYTQEVSAFSSPRHIENNSIRVFLRGNPLTCDCHIYHLVRYFGGKLIPEVNYLIDFDATNLTCAKPNELKGQSLKNIDERLLTCNLEGEECPKPCSCFFRRFDKGLLIDCSSKSLTSLPPWMPSDIQTLEATNHTELDLSNNLITSIGNKKDPFLLKGYERVTKLYLNRNNLSSFDLRELPYSGKNLKVLELEGNNLTRLDQMSLLLMQENKNLTRITLHNNPWFCDCDSKYLLNFLLSNFMKVPHLKEIMCSGGRPGKGNENVQKNVSLAEMTITELCPSDWVIWGIGWTVTCIALLSAALAAFYYRYQTEIKVWLYSKGLCLKWVTEEELDREKKYDAFVSYSHKDEEFVTKELVPSLEGGGRGGDYKLCLHYRDWIIGDFIPAQIARSVEESRRTLVVLSPGFLESIWGRMEFRTAHSQALKEGRARVIVVLYGDVGPVDQLDSELKAYLTMNTYVQWGDPWFWDKLRYALPHSSRKRTTSVSSPDAVSTKSAPFFLLRPLISIFQGLKPSSQNNLSFDEIADQNGSPTLKPDPDPIDTPPANIFIDPLTQSLKEPKPI